MKTMKQLVNRLNKLIGYQWKSDCAMDCEVTRQTVKNTLNGTHHNVKVKMWIKDKIEEQEHLFI